MNPAAMAGFCFVNISGKTCPGRQEGQVKLTARKVIAQVRMATGIFD